jgi:hypothetical protein
MQAQNVLQAAVRHHTQLRQPQFMQQWLSPLEQLLGQSEKQPHPLAHEQGKSE